MDKPSVKFGILKRINTDIFNINYTMKKLYTFLMFIVTVTIAAQASQGFNYQATVRNNAGVLIINKSVSFKFNIIPTSASGTAVYSESQTVTTDDLGQVSLVIGKGTATTGTFATIDWATGTYYLGIELNTGNGFVAMGATQLLSVPYALYAKNAGGALPIGTEKGQILYWNGTAWVDLTANQTLTLEVGPGSYPNNCSFCTQAGGPGTPITITKTINNSFVRYNGNLVGSPAYIGQAKFRGLGLHNIQIFTPYDPYFPIGETTALVAKTASWDPLSLSGVSNFGTGYATGYEPSATCPTIGSYVSAQRPCMRFMVDRTQSVKLLGSYHGVISGTTDDK